MRRTLTLVALALLPVPAGTASERIAGALETEDPAAGDNDVPDHPIPGPADPDAADARDRRRLDRRGPAAPEPHTLDAVVTRDALPSLRALLDERVQFRVAPEVFCLDLYREFDVDRLTALAEPTKIDREGGRQ